MKETNNRIYQIHDKAFSKALRNQKVALDAMKSFLPKALLVQADLAKAKLFDTKFISAEFKEFRADIIYEIPLNAQPAQKGLFFCHFEHQSTVDKFLPLRIWQYLFSILKDYQENHPKAALPIVYPIIIYTGEGDYTASTNLFDLFGEQKDLAKDCLTKAVKLVDVCRLSDKEIKKHQLFGLTEFAFKHRNTKVFSKFLDNFLAWIGAIESDVSEDYVIMLMKYMVVTYAKAKPEELIEKSKTYLSAPIGEKVMTIAEQLKQQGMQQGMQQGVQQGMQQGKIKRSHEIAVKLLKEGMTIEKVSKLTDLPMTVLEQCSTADVSH